MGGSRKHPSRKSDTSAKAIRYLAERRNVDNCRSTFKELKILTAKLVDAHNHQKRHASNSPLESLHLEPSYNVLEESKTEPNQTLTRKPHKWMKSRPFYTEKEFLEWRRREYEFHHIVIPTRNFINTIKYKPIKFYTYWHLFSTSMFMNKIIF